MDMNILPACVVCAPPKCLLGTEVKEGVRSLKTGVMDGYELPRGCWDWSLGHLKSSKGFYPLKHLSLAPND